MSTRTYTGVVFLFLMFMLPGMALSHSLSDSYLNLSVSGNTAVDGQWLIAVEDMELAVGLDADGDTHITWNEILQKQAAINSYLLSSLALDVAGQNCGLQFGNLMLEQLNAGMFLHVPVQANCASTGPLQVSYSLLFDIDLSHRGILTAVSGDASQVHLFSPSSTNHIIDSNNISAIKNVWTFVVEGIWHIWIGLDHILFLCALLIPIVAEKRRAGRALSVDILQVVTAFTVAHSITLILATLEIVVLPSRFVESVIALSVAVTGLNMIWPLFRGHSWKFAFGFGLIHGFGFAGVLSDLSLPTHLFVSSLLSFNVGVEIGQLAIVLVLVPALLLLGRASTTQKLTVAATGIVITGFGLVWLLERSLNLSLTRIISIV
ncbi:MAG: HupE/UreJ family protein [Gammaproteobacteria bacterium]|nr:HupE/UreJ family protein [Gammaproteobacteria bacterium]